MLKIWIYSYMVLSVSHAEVFEYHSYPQYSFEYGVNDPGTQDVKKHWETRNGDKVDGSYSIKEADGTVRIVEYHANDRTGFNAIVRREGHAIHPPTHNHIHIPSQTFMHTATHRPVVHIPMQTHTIIQTSVNHNPMETHIHTPIHTTIKTPTHSFVTTSVNHHNPVETILHTPVQDSVQNHVHTQVSTSMSNHHSLDSIAHSHHFQTTAQNPEHSEVRYFVRTPVHIPEETPSIQTPVHVIHNSVKTPEYAVVHSSRKVSLGTSIHTPIETTVQVPLKHVLVEPEVTVHHHTRTATTSLEHEKKPEVYKSEIAGAHSASFISAVV